VEVVTVVEPAFVDTVAAAAVQVVLASVQGLFAQGSLTTQIGWDEKSAPTFRHS